MVYRETKSARFSNILLIDLTEESKRGNIVLRYDVGC